MGVVSALFKAVFLLFASSGFSIAGLNKITDQLNPETYHYLQQQAVYWHSVLPKIADIDLKTLINATDYLPFIGYTELVGALFLIIPGLHTIGTFILLGVSSGAIYTHLQLGQTILPPAILGAAVLLLFILRKTTGHKAKAKVS